MFPLNQVFKVKKRRMRLLWNDGNQAFWIDVDSPTAWPELVLVSEIEKMLIGDVIVYTEDPYLDYILCTVEPNSLGWKKRELAWDKLRDEVSNPELFYRKERGLAISRIVANHAVTHQTANRLLRRYWQRGMTQNAFLPDYHRSGAAGKKRKPGSKKLGRPRSVELGRGCNITPATERIFRQAIEACLLNQNPTSVADAHARALNVLRAASPTLTAAELPTVQQFRYFYKREYSQPNVLMKQKSPIDYASNYRPLLGTSTTETHGPGYRYQVDATVADIYLLSDYDRTRIVGRPVIYVVTDVFSRMITGLHVGFEGPSWTSAMIAIVNTIGSKAEYCKRFGVEIEESDWPAQGLPTKILADKGEFNGTKVEAFCAAFGTAIENATARRGDAKGIVERHFRTLQETFKPYVAGVVGPSISRKRGGEDYRQDATLTLRDFTEILIHAVLYRNNYQSLSKYDRCEGMGKDVPAVPLYLWNWGTSNLTGRLRMAPMDLVRINLMPHAEATISDFGFRLFGCFYTCPEGIQQGWFHRTKNDRPVKVTVAYDPQTANHIYVRPSNNLKDYWVCDLTDRSRRFRNMSFWDVFATTKPEKKVDAKAALEAPIEKGELLKKIDAISKRAKKQKPTAGPLSRKDLGMQIRENKQTEKQHERAANAFKPERKKHGGPGEVISLRKEPEVDYSYPDLSHLLFEGDDDDSV